MVAPRVIPTYWFLRLVCAIAISILLLNTMTVALLVVPLALGKYLFSVFCFPIWLQHDPLILIVGMSICAVVGYYCFLAYSYNALEQWKILSQQRYRGTITKGMYIYTAHNLIVSKLSVVNVYDLLFYF